MYVYVLYVCCSVDAHFGILGLLNPKTYTPHARDPPQEACPSRLRPVPTACRASRRATFQVRRWDFRV